MQEENRPAEEDPAPLDAEEDQAVTEEPQVAASTEERQERLARVVSTKTLEGWTVVDRNERDAWAILDLPGKPVNHVLHALITIFSCGLWAIVWAILALTQRRQQRVRVSIDAYGNLLEETVTIA
jgi:YD repeat-containing protein